MFFGGFLEHLANSGAGVGGEEPVVNAVVEDLVNPLTKAPYSLMLAISLNRPKYLNDFWCSDLVDGQGANEGQYI